MWGIDQSEPSGLTGKDGATEAGFPELWRVLVPTILQGAALGCCTILLQLTAAAPAALPSSQVKGEGHREGFRCTCQ